MTPETTLHPKIVQAIKNLQASYNTEASRIMEQVKCKKSCTRKLKKFVISLVIMMVIEGTMNISRSMEPSRCCHRKMDRGNEEHDQAASMMQDH